MRYLLTYFFRRFYEPDLIYLGKSKYLKRLERMIDIESFMLNCKEPQTWNNCRRTKGLLLPFWHEKIYLERKGRISGNYAWQPTCTWVLKITGFSLYTAMKIWLQVLLRSWLVTCYKTIPFKICNDFQMGYCASMLVKG